MNDESLLPTFEPRNEKKQSSFSVRLFLSLIGLLGVGFLILGKNRVFVPQTSSTSRLDNFLFNTRPKTTFQLPPWSSTGEVVFLNASICNDGNESCYANNVDGYYLAFNFSSNNSSDKTPPPSFTLNRRDVVELLWFLPETPVRYLGATTYVKITSQGDSVFADVGETLNFVQIAQYCHLSTTDELWGRMIRLLFSANEAVKNIDFGDNVCTLIMPIPGPPLNNFTHYGDETKDRNATHFSVILRLTAPESAQSMFHYLNSLSNFTRLRKFQMETQDDKFFPYPTYIPRSHVSGEIDAQLTKQLFRALVNHVVDALFMTYPSLVVKQVDETYPWLAPINYTYAGGYACINTSNDCQGAQVDATYMRSRLNNISTSSHFITVGPIHHDFLDTSFYSSMSLYKLSPGNRDSGTGVLSFMDMEQRGSAVGYITTEKGEHRHHGPSEKFWSSYTDLLTWARATPLNDNQVADHEWAKFAQSFYVTETSYKCLDKLPSSTRCKTFTTDQISLDSDIFMLGRTYANPGPDPIDLLPDIVLHVLIDN